MRTWSVRGTAFALCTRSSSLSMRTRTSMARSLLRGADGSPGPAVGVQLAEPLCHSSRHQAVDVSTERRDLLDSARGDEADLGARHHVHRLDVRGERPVELVHLELPLEVGDHAQALHDHLGVPFAGELHDELPEDVDLHVVDALERLAPQDHPLLYR